MSQNLVILDIQHRGKPGVRDMGASHDLDGDGVIEAMEQEASLTPFIAKAARRVLQCAGIQVVVIDTGAYSTRHRKAAELARGVSGWAAYAALHANAGGGDYGFAGFDAQSSNGGIMATDVMRRLQKLPELRRAITVRSGPTGDWVNTWHTIKGIWQGPQNLSGICYEPGFLDNPDHAALWTEEGLERAGHVLANGLITYFRRKGAR